MSSVELRKRGHTPRHSPDDTASSRSRSSSKERDGRSKHTRPQAPAEQDSDGQLLRSSLKGSWWLSRIVYVRFVSFIYFVAFLVAAQQYVPLLGEKGLTPAKRYMESIGPRLPDSPWEKAKEVPSLFWFFSPSDSNVLTVCYTGMGVSFLLMSGLVMWAPAMLLLWALYHSLNSMGQTWYSFGWESQLLETGFLAVFMCPFLSISAMKHTSPPPAVPFWANRWLLFRIMLGAGLIKIRGDQCWRDLTCMLYHYETQPVPNPISWYLHNLPREAQLFSTLANHIIELPAPWLLLIPHRTLRTAGGCLQILFQCVLIISGNLSFLNWLTIAPALTCLDDAFWAFLFSAGTLKRVVTLRNQENASVQSWRDHVLSIFRFWRLDGDDRRGIFAVVSTTSRSVVQTALLCLIVVYSRPVVANLLAERQIMNTSFDPFKLVNTYGAFGSVGKKRTEIVIEGAHANPASPPVWKEYEFKCKPGNVARRPCLISPYHYRLDWLAWFAGFQTYQHQPWLVHLILKMMRGDPLVDELLASNPFSGGSPPDLVRVLLYKYKYTTYKDCPLGPLLSDCPWWRREVASEYLPALDKNNPSLDQFVRGHGWIA